MTTSILIVEDESIVAVDLQESLLGCGYDAYAIVDTGEDAIRQVSLRCPDVVLMDIRIRGLRDGIETAGILRDRFDVPIIYLTAHTDTSTLQRAKATEPYGYLVKPIRMAELRSTIEMTLDRRAIERRQPRDR